MAKKKNVVKKVITVQEERRYKQPLRAIINFGRYTLDVDISNIVDSAIQMTLICTDSITGKKFQADAELLDE